MDFTPHIGGLYTAYRENLALKPVAMKRITTSYPQGRINRIMRIIKKRLFKFLKKGEIKHGG
jgi:hypothetical protein